MAYDKEDRIVGGTINLIKNTHFYGRYWGSFKFVKNLHFEACYYKAIEYCILHGITYMEPGAGDTICVMLCSVLSILSPRDKFLNSISHFNFNLHLYSLLSILAIITTFIHSPYLYLFIYSNYITTILPGGGEFKFLRGFNPYIVNSVHHFRSRELGSAVENFLIQERMRNQVRTHLYIVLSLFSFLYYFF